MLPMFRFIITFHQETLCVLETLKYFNYVVSYTISSRY